MDEVVDRVAHLGAGTGSLEGPLRDWIESVFGTFPSTLFFVKFFLKFCIRVNGVLMYNYGVYK